MAGDQLDFGRRLKQIRKERNLTLTQVSELTGVPVSALSRVENGINEITFRRAISISEGLEIPLMQFISDMSQDHSGRRTITRAKPVATKKPKKSNIVFEVLCEDVLSKRSFFWKVTVYCDSVEDFGKFSQHPGEEFIYVLDGILELHCAHYKPVRLKKGDSIFFDGQMEHAYVKGGKKPAVLLMSNTIEPHVNNG